LIDNQMSMKEKTPKKKHENEYTQTKSTSQMDMYHPGILQIHFFGDFMKKSDEPISSLELKNNLSKGLTTQLTDWGLHNYDGNYLWYSDFDESGIKKVFTYIRLKGNSGVFAWGVCFDFIPTFSHSKRLKNHTTDKSTTLHLFDWPEGYRNSFEGGGRPTGIISHYSGECEKDIRTVVAVYKNIIATFYTTASTIDGALDVTMSQIWKKGAYEVHFPHPEYVYSFLLAKTGQKEQAIDIMYEFFKNNIEHDDSWKLLYKEIEKRIKSC
jgi:hypothetical protein